MTLAPDREARRHPPRPGKFRLSRLKSIDLHIRPIHNHLAGRVRTHIFLCMLAYYVEWYLREAWRDLLFADEDLGRKAHRAHA